MRRPLCAVGAVMLALLQAALGQPAAPAVPAAAAAAGEEDDQAPRTPYLMLPPFLERRVIYYHSFAGEEPEINRAEATASSPLSPLAAGFHGRCARLAAGRGFTVASPAFSPHRPITVSFWWCIPEPLPENAGLNLFALTNSGRGYISSFAKGGPWCGLTDTAFCFQVYNLPGIKNVHTILERGFRQLYSQGPGEWHHTVLTLSLGSRLALQVDGERVSLALLSGRTLQADDNLRQLGFGRHNQRALLLDEVVIMDVALTDEQARAYFRMIRSLEETGHLR